MMKTLLLLLASGQLHANNGFVIGCNNCDENALKKPEFFAAYAKYYINSEISGIINALRKGKLTLES